MQDGFSPLESNALPRTGGLARFWKRCPKRLAQCDEIRPLDVRPSGLFENRAQGPTVSSFQAHASWWHVTPPLSTVRVIQRWGK
jgi:hypothetical protein